MEKLQHEYSFRCGIHTFCNVQLCYATLETATKLAQDFCDRNGHTLIEVRPYPLGGLSVAEA